MHLLQEYQIQCMEVRKPSKLNDRSSNPLIVIEGIEDVIKKDLDKHRVILERTSLEVLSYRSAVSVEVKKRKHFKSLLGGGKYNDESLEQARVQMGVNIKQLQDKIKLCHDKIEHETLIVDTLTDQLANQYRDLKVLQEYRKTEK